MNVTDWPIEILRLVGVNAKPLCVIVLVGAAVVVVVGLTVVVVIGAAVVFVIGLTVVVVDDIASVIVFVDDFAG